MQKKKNYILIFFFIFLNSNNSLFSNKIETEKRTFEFNLLYFQNKEGEQVNFPSIKNQYNEAYTLYKNSKYIDALEIALPIYEKCKKEVNPHYFHLVSILIADIYYKTNSYDKSISFYKTALSPLLEKNKYSFEISKNKNDSIYSSLSKTYLQIGSLFQKKYTYNSKKINLVTPNFKDSAIYYYKKLENLPPLSKTISKYKAISYYNLSAIFQKDKQYKKAEEYALKAVGIHKANRDKINLSSSLNNLGNIYMSLNKFKRAKNIYINGIKLIEKNNSQKAIKTKANLYYNLAWAMRNLKDYKAYDYQELSYEIEDNQREKEIREIIEKVTLNHKENLEKQKVALIKAKTKLIKTKEESTTLLFGALSLLVIVISGGLVYNYKLRKDNLQLKLSENSLKQQQSIEKIKSDAQTKILNATIDGKESERKQIAETLHDNVSALLSSANMHLSATKKQINGVTPLEIEKTQAIILEASQKVRDLSHNLISSILLKFGLEYALKDIAKKFSNSELTFKVSALNINRYNQEFEIKVFNIIQELVNNILKHSKATYAQIIIKQEKNQLTVLVNDDGVGFSTSSSSFKNNGIGLNQIEARIKMMNGKFTINSESNKGTKVSIIIPIQQQKPFQFSSVS